MAWAWVQSVLTQPIPSPSPPLKSGSGHELCECEFNGNSRTSLFGA